MKPLSYIEISKANLLHNIKMFRSLLGKHVQLAAVVKGNAYGHGQNEVIKVLEKTVDYFQVDDLQELELLRKVTQKPALVLGYVAQEELDRAVSLKATLGVYTIGQLGGIEKIGKLRERKVPVHVKIDALLGRQGVPLHDLNSFLLYLSKLKHVQVQALYTHFSNIEDTSSFAHAQKQINAFAKAGEMVRAYGFKNIKYHLSATSGVLAYEPKGTSDLVRIGIGLYGMWPSKNLQRKYEKKGFYLKPVLRWVTHIAQVKLLPPNYPIGYGLTHVTKKKTKVAVIPQGYSDGYDRGLSNIGEVLIDGKRCKVLGRVAMNMFVVDVTHIRNAQQEGEVVLLGPQGKDDVTAEEIAAKIDTINYEVTTRITPLLPRIVK